MKRNSLLILLVECVHVIERSCLVRTAIDTRDISIVRSGEWIVFVIVKVNQPETDIIFLRRHDIEIATIDLLLLGILFPS